MYGPNPDPSDPAVAGSGRISPTHADLSGMCQPCQGRDASRSRAASFPSWSPRRDDSRAGGTHAAKRPAGASAIEALRSVVDHDRRRGDHDRRRGRDPSFNPAAETDLRLQGRRRSGQERSTMLMPEPDSRRTMATSRIIAAPGRPGSSASAARSSVGEAMVPRFPWTLRSVNSA